MPSNIAGGFTLLASGGTLNDGSGVSGLSILVTLRDSQGWGPTQTWTITIKDPNNTTYTVEYNDPRIGSYMSWEWAALNPPPGTYRATATNGVTTIYQDFTVSSTQLSRVAPNATSSGSNITITWPSVGAGSYSYDVCAPDFTCISGFTTSTSETVSFGTLTQGDYWIQVKAYSTDRVALSANHTSSPQLAPQEKVSEYFFTFPVGGDQTDHYSLNAAGGVLDYGLRGPGNTPIYGLAIWTSIQDITSHPSDTAPAGNWNIVITDPNGMNMNYIYQAGSRHDLMWYYALEPVSAATYTVRATYGSVSKTAAFTLANTPPNLAPLSYNQISASLVSNVTNSTLNDVNISWTPPVTNAASYYVSLYSDIWDNASKQYVYTEVWRKWVNTNSVRVINGGVGAGLQCDVFVAASQVDMTTDAPPASVPTGADMSENYYGYPLPFATP